jgi:hypothetical protein
MDLRPVLNWLRLVACLVIVLASVAAPRVLAEPATPTYAGGLIPSEGDFPRLATTSQIFSTDLPLPGGPERLDAPRRQPGRAE